MNNNMKDTPFYERLLMAQVYLKAPKGQKNDFGDIRSVQQKISRKKQNLSTAY